MDQERIASLYLYEPIQHTLSYLNKIIFIYWYICIHFILQTQLLINILRSKSKLKMLFIPRFENLMTSIKNLSRRQKFPIFIKSDLYSRSFKLLFCRLQVEHFCWKKSIQQIFHVLIYFNGSFHTKSDRNI